MIAFLRQLFCRHRWLAGEAQPYDKISAAGVIVGSVVLQTHVCIKCQKAKLKIINSTRI